MNKSLLSQVITKFLAGIIFVSLLLFIPAGTIRYWNAWLFIGLLFIPMLILGAILYVKKPELLRKRLETKERQSEQKTVIAISALMFVTGFIVAGLDYRYGWSKLPPGLVLASGIVLILAYLLYMEVLRENQYLSRVVEVQENQKVISSGLYGIVRHPMYTAVILLFLSMPLVLGSLYSFLIFSVLPFLIAVRIRGEERLLEQGLPGYSEYKQRVKYKLIPFIW